MTDWQEHLTEEEQKWLRRGDGPGEFAYRLAEARETAKDADEQLSNCSLLVDRLEEKLAAVETLANHWCTNGSLGDRELMGKMLLAILEVKGE